MAQIFHHSTNLISRLSIYGGVFIIAALGAALYGIELSPWYTDQHVARQQPVPFSHKHHAGELGIDCRYCHDKSIAWTRVNALPDFVYFDHSIHVSKGVGCTTCHGPIAEMPLTWRAGTLYMQWCLECHREPEKYVRPKSEVFNPYYEPPKNQIELGRKLVKEYKIQSLQNCSTCHR